jgi:DNA end-binding protein Ku
LIRAAKDGLLLHTLYYPDELHTEKRQSAPAKVNATKQEVELAVKLIHQLAAPFKPEQFHDAYRENVEHLIAEKKKDRTIAAEPSPRKAPVVDLMEALKKSPKSPAKASAKATGRRRVA